MFMFCFGVLWFLIIPKWLINDSGHIAILVGTFLLGLPTNRPKVDTRTPYLLQKHIETYKKIWKHVIKHTSVYKYGNIEL